jgi:sirohydrochlorin cobaltochelatase
MLPLFLGMGKHAREDMPVLVRQLFEQYPDIRFILKPSVGEHPQVINLLAELALA